MDIETQMLIFEARIIIESVAIGLSRVSDVSKIEIIRRMIAQADELLARAASPSPN